MDVLNFNTMMENQFMQKINLSEATDKSAYNIPK